MSGVISTEFPRLTAGNFESSLASDDVLALFFNDFLSLPVFSEDVMYNQDSGLFELVNGAADCVSRRIRTVLKHIKSQLLAGDTTVLTRHPPVDNQYTVSFLDREKGIQWIKRERLPLFLKSDCYYEYRLAKLFLQQGPQLSASQMHQCSQFTKQGSDAVKAMSSRGEESKSTNEGFSPRDLKCGPSAVLPRDPCCQMSDPPEQKLQDAVSVVGGLHLLNTEEPAHQKNCTRTQTEKEVQTEWDEKDQGSGVRNQENRPDACWEDPFSCGTGPGFHEFSEVLQGRQGAKLLRLWMDIERLKAAQNAERKNRHLLLMRNWYLLSRGCSSLSVGLLSRLALTTSPCWTEDKLLSVQPYITESLLGYWDNQFCISYNDSTAFHHPDTFSHRPPHITPTELLFSRTRSLCSGRMKKLLKALCVETRSGLYFTHFCERSGNQLWVNAVYFWTDLQYYHELFHQEELDSYRVQREAQLLHFTYICSSAKRDTGIDEVLRKEVYDGLMPASEDLFDRVEEHVLNVLLEPWTLLVGGDKESFHQVRVQEEVRHINSPEYQELLGLYEEPHEKPKEVEESKPSTTPALDPWSGMTSDDLLRSILGQHHQIENFKFFLQKLDASIHLLCWLDLEEYRRTPHKDRAVRQDWSLNFANKYLNKKYFFGPRSPATAEQQDDMLRSAGGHERLTSGCLSDSVVVGIQDIIKAHIEETWLPLFLSTTKVTGRQEHKPELHAADTFSLHVNHRQRWRRDASKEAHPEGLWMSSSKEILLFRRILLNPVTSQQFQYFVSLKGGFLENDVRFWVEVQRYKDLCHSHSDEATIQQKISIIISCFINSPMQPTLQIDIPLDQAQRILEKRHELGPYIFREAQISVFGELLKFWPEFQAFTGSVQEEQLIPLLHEKRVQYRARQRRRRRKEEEEEEMRRKAYDELVRKELSLTEVDNDEEEMERKGRGVKKQSTWSRKTPTPTQPLLQSCSKYMVGLKREDVLLRKQSQLAASSSTVSEASSDGSIKSAGAKLRPRTDGKQK